MNLRASISTVILSSLIALSEARPKEHHHHHKHPAEPLSLSLGQDGLAPPTHSVSSSPGGLFEVVDILGSSSEYKDATEMLALDPAYGGRVSILFHIHRNRTFRSPTATLSVACDHHKQVIHNYVVDSKLFGAWCPPVAETDEFQCSASTDIKKVEAIRIPKARELPDFAQHCGLMSMEFTIYGEGEEVPVLIATFRVANLVKEEPEFEEVFLDEPEF